MKSNRAAVEVLEPRLLYSADVFGVSDAFEPLDDELVVKPLATDDGSTIEYNYNLPHADVAVIDTFNTQSSLDGWLLTEVPDHGALYLNGVEMALGDIAPEDDVLNGQLSYQHDGTTNLSDTILWQHSHNDHTHDNYVRINFDIAAPNTAAVLEDDLVVFTGTSGSIATSTLLANDTDADGDTLVISGFDQPAQGTLTIESSGNLEFTETAADPADNIQQAANVTVRELDSSYIFAAPLVTSLDEMTGIGSPIGGTASLSDDGSGASFFTGANGLNYGAFSFPDTFQITIEANADSISTGTNMLYSIGAAADEGSITVYTADLEGRHFLIAHMGDLNALPDIDELEDVNSVAMYIELDNSYFAGWHDVTLTVDSDGMASLALDGVVGDQKDVSGTAFQGGDFRVGNDFYTIFSLSRPFEGTLRNLYIRDLDGLGTTTPDVHEADSTLTFRRFGDTESVAQDDAVTVESDGTVSSTLLSVDSLAQNDTFSTSSTVSHDWSLDSGPAFGAVTVNSDGSFSYSQTSATQSNDSFTYTLTSDYTDGTTSLWQVTTSATVTLDASGVVVGSPPVAVDDAITVAEGGSVSQTASLDGSLFDNDTDPDSDTLSLVDHTDPTYGTVVINADGTFTYQHDGSENFSDQFTYAIVDSAGNNAGTRGTVTVTVTPVNDNSPVVTNESLYVELGGVQDTLLSGSSSVLANDTDLDTDDTLTVQLLNHSSWLDVDLYTDGTFLVYDDIPLNAANGYFTYRVFDSAGNYSDGSVSIDVGPNYRPVAANDTLTVDEGGEIDVTNSGALSLFDNDTDSNNQDVNLVSYTTPAHGALTVNNDGTFSYVHDGSENFTDQFDYLIEDAMNLEAQESATVFININSINDNTPIAVTESIAVDFGETVSSLVGGASSLLDNDTDADAADSLAAYLVRQASNGTVTVNTDGTFSYTHNALIAAGSDSFRYRVVDAAGNDSEVDVTVTISPNTAPVANTDYLEVDEGAAIALTNTGGASLLLNDSDADGDAIVVSNHTAAAYGLVTVASDGTFTYTHDGSENFSDSFRYTLEDEHGTPASADGVVYININAINDNVPNAVNDAINVSYGESQSQLVSGQLSLLSNDSDTDADDSLVASLLTGPSKGTVTVNANGTFAYSHTSTEAGSDSFSYSVTDTAGQSSSATVTVTIEPENVPPVFLGGERDMQFHEGVSDSVALSSFFSDDNAMTYEIQAGNQAFMTLNKNTGDLEVNATSADVGTHIIEVVVTDEIGQSVTQEFEIVVLSQDVPTVEPPPTTTTRSVPETGSEPDVDPDDAVIEGSVETDDADTSEATTGTQSITESTANGLLALWEHVEASYGGRDGVEVEIDGLLGGIDGGSRPSLLGYGSDRASFQVYSTEGLSLSNLLDGSQSPDTAALVDTGRAAGSNFELAKANTALAPAVTTATAATGFSLGYLLWLARSGFLLSTVLSALPAWRNMDPLPVLGSLSDTASDTDDPEDKSLSELTERD